MKPSILLLFLSISISLFAQQSYISGVVAVFNSAFETGTRQYVPNAQIEDDFKKATATTTGPDGRFKLVFVGIKNNEKVSFNVKKEKMEIVNTEALYAVAGQKEQVALFMSPEGKLAENKLKYYHINREVAEKALTTKLKTIGDEILKLKQNEAANAGQIAKLQTEYNALHQQYEKIDQSAREMAERYAKINLDDQTKEYQSAFRYFQKGQLEEALKILNQVDLEKTGNSIVQEQERNRKIDKEWIERDSIKNEKKRQVSEGLSFKAQLHKTQFEFVKVEETYQLLLRLDSTNVYSIWAFAGFLSEQNKIHEAINHYEKALVLAQSPELKATFLNNLGNLYFANQKMPQAEAVFNEALKIRRVLAQKNLDLFLDNLSGTLDDLGKFYGENQKIFQAEAAFNEALTIIRQLALENPEVFSPNLATTLNNLGSFFHKNLKMSQAEAAYKEALKIRQELVLKNPDEYSYDLTVSLNNLGIYYHDNQKMGQAEVIFNEALSLRRHLAIKNPDAFLPNLATSLNNLGLFYRNIQKITEAEVALNEALAIRRQLALINPDAYLNDLAVTLNNLGLNFTDNQKMPQAEAAYNEALIVIRQLVLKNPDVFLHDLAINLNNLGLFYAYNQKGGQAETTYHEALTIVRQLSLKNPSAFLYTQATILKNLGNYYNDNQKASQAEALYKEALTIIRQLALENSNAFLDDLALALNNIGLYYSNNQRYPQAEIAYQEALAIIRRLAQENPDEFLPELARTLNNLGVFFKEIKNYKTSLIHYKEALLLRESAILKGGIHQFKSWVIVLNNINIIIDSLRLIKDYQNTSYAVKLIAESCDKLIQVDKELKVKAVFQYGDLSWCALLAKDHTLSEKAALRCLELDHTQEWVLTNLGHSQLLRGQYATAKATYEKLKGKKDGEGKDYKQVLLDDLNALETEGVTHKDFAQARAAIEKW